MEREPIKTGYPWRTKVEYYNTDGEQIEKKQALRHYVKIENKKIYYHENGYNITDQTIVCEKSRQTELF